MANIENINVLRVDGTQAITTLRDLKAAIEADKDALVALGLVEDSDNAKKAEQEKITKKLKDELDLLNNVMKAGKTMTIDNAKAVDVQTDSYYDLQKALTTLKKAWKDMSAEERTGAVGAETLQKIRELDASLKTMDADIGQFQRNVGNYGQSFKQSLEEAQKGAMGLTQGLQSVNGIMALTGDSSNSLVKALGAVQVVAGLLNSSKGIVGYIKHLREVTAATKATTAATKGQTAAMQAETVATEEATVATKVFKTALATLGVGAVLVLVGELIAHLDDLARTFGIVDEEAEAQHKATLKRLEDMDAEFQKQQKLLQAAGASKSQQIIEDIQGIRDLAHEAYEDYSKFYDEYNDMTLVEQWASDLSNEKIDEMLEKHRDYVQQIRAAYVDLEAVVVSYVNASNLERAQEGMSEYEKSIDNLRRTANDAAQALEVLRERGQVTAEEYAQYSQQILDTFNYQADKVVEKAKADAEAERKRRAAEAAARLKAERDAALAIQRQAEQAQKTELQKLEEKYETEKAQLEKFGLDTTALTENYQAARTAVITKSIERQMAAIEKQNADAKAAMAKRAEEERKAASAAAEAQMEIMEKLAEQRTRLSEAAIDDDDKAAAASYEIEVQSYRDRIEALEQFRLEALSLGDQEAALKYQQEAADLSVEIEIREAEEKQRIRQRDKASREQAAKETVASASSILGALADIYEADTKASEAERRKAKNLRIAAATIDMLQGAVTAFSVAQELGPVIGPIVGAANAAAVIAAGTANIRKIRAQQVSATATSADSGFVSSPAVSAPVFQPEVTQVRTVTSASEEELLNQPSRVYILQSDLEAAAGESRARVAESTF